MAWHVIWYGLAGIAWYIMAWQASRSIWYGLAGEALGLALYMVWPDGHSMIYDMAWRPWQGIRYGLAGITWYMVWLGGHRMVYGIAWQGISWHVERQSITCFKALPWAIVPFTRGVAVVSWRFCWHVPDQGLLHVCSAHTYSSCSFWVRILNRDLLCASYHVLSVDQAFVMANTC